MRSIERLRESNRSGRRGAATLWLVIWLPCLLILFCMLLGAANLWLARNELENAMESAALAAVKHWGDQGGGFTQEPRDVGVAYAAANRVRGQSVTIGTNYDPSPAGGPNQNADCMLAMTPPTANLIFGSIDNDDPDHVIFDAGELPSCGGGQVLFDATGQGGGGGGLSPENAWGISFQKTPMYDSGLRITKIIIRLQNGATFTGPLTISDETTSSAVAVKDNEGVQVLDVNYQHDTVGFTDVPQQITWTISGDTLTFMFHPDLPDEGFSPGDRFRFGIEVDGGNGQNDGDGIGENGTQVEVFFENGGGPIMPTSTGVFVDHTERKNDCFSPALQNATTGTLAVNPSEIPDLPCPPSAAPKNNGQSYVLLTGGGTGKFGVRAQAQISIPPLGRAFLGALGPYCIQAKATAEYDCVSRRVRLIRVDEFICP